MTVTLVNPDGLPKVDVLVVSRRRMDDQQRRALLEGLLNFGDCFSYALARDLHEPLLFRGEDFPHTDIAPGL